MAANSRLQTTESLADVVGPGLAGLLIQLMRAPFALIADAASFFVSAASVVAISARELPPSPGPPSGSGFFRAVFGDIRAGLAFTFRHPVLRPLAAASATFNAFATIMLTIFVVYAARTAHMSPGQIGLVFAAFGVGGVIGAAFLGRTMKAGAGRLLATGYVVGACPPPPLLGAGVGAPAPRPWILLSKVRSVRSLEELN